VTGSVTIPIAIESSAVTFDVHISSSDVVFEATVTASDIMMPVDIQAQYIDLDVNIASSEVTLNIAIQSSAVTLNVLITNSSIAVTGTVSIAGTVAISGTVSISGTVTITGTVNISGTVTITGAVSITGVASITITAQTVGVSIQGEWQIQQGNLKTLNGGASAGSGATATPTSWTVTAGKTFYIYGIMCATVSYSTGLDDPQEANFDFDVNGVSVCWPIVGAAQQTVSINFSTPIKATSGQLVRLRATNQGYATGMFIGSIWGYVT
jgi:hypothetical protein